MALGSSLRAEPQPALTISGSVVGSSAKNPVYVALWAADGFLARPVRQIKLSAGAERAFSFDVQPGRWAISAFEDRNGNGILDMGIFGPKEPSGFWRAFSGWHKPRFDEVAVQVDHSVTNATVALK
jgi:uncharacterized protein (DUF2141 family)